MGANLAVQGRFFAAIAPLVPRAMGMALRSLGISGRLVERNLAVSPVTNALIRTTAAATIVSGGVKSNVLPQEARAVINFRILPGDTMAGVLEHVRGVVGDQVSVRVLEGGLSSDPPPLSNPDSAAFGLVADSIERVFPDVAAVAPWILMGATDARHFTGVAGECLRFVPFRATSGDMTRIHGTGERIRVSDADGVVAFYMRLIEAACATA